MGLRTATRFLVFPFPQPMQDTHRPRTVRRNVPHGMNETSPAKHGDNSPKTCFMISAQNQRAVKALCFLVFCRDGGWFAVVVTWKLGSCVEAQPW